MYKFPGNNWEAIVHSVTKGFTLNTGSHCKKLMIQVAIIYDVSNDQGTLMKILGPVKSEPSHTFYNLHHSIQISERNFKKLQCYISTKPKKEQNDIALKWYGNGGAKDIESER